MGFNNYVASIYNLLVFFDDYDARFIKKLDLDSRFEKKR